MKTTNGHRRFVVPLLAFVLLIQGSVALRGRSSAHVELQAAPAQATAARKMSGEWKQFDSPNFRILGRVPDAEFRDVASQLETFRDMLTQMFPSVQLKSRVPTTIVVFSNAEMLTRFNPLKNGKHQDYAGYFMSSRDMNYIVLGVHRDSDLVMDVAFHEYVHYVLRQAGWLIPTWVSEGLAEYYSTFRLDRSRHAFVVGNAPPNALYSLRDNATLLPLDKMTSEAGAREFMNDARVYKFYGQSWALVHYLNLGQERKRQMQLDTYLAALGSGMTLDNAFNKAFGCTYRQMEAELDQYLRAYALPGIVIPETELTSTKAGAIQKMAEADAQALQGDLLVRIGDFADAEKFLRKALEIEPEHPGARSSMALMKVMGEKAGRQ